MKSASASASVSAGRTHNHAATAAHAAAAVATAAVAAGAHALYVARERKRVPALLRFSPGSADDILSERLRTGDLVLFARDCTLYTGCAGVVCAARRASGGSEFDHAGVIVRAGVGSAHDEHHIFILGNGAQGRERPEFGGDLLRRRGPAGRAAWERGPPDG